MPPKKKVNTVIVPAKPIEHTRTAFQDQLSWINKEIKYLLEKSDIWVDLTPETEAIGDSLSKLEEKFTELYEQADSTDEELEKAKEDLLKLDEDYDKISSALDLISEYNTCTGTLKFQTDNLLDENVMDLFTCCMLHIPPVKLIEILKDIIQKENIRL